MGRVVTYRTQRVALVAALLDGDYETAEQLIADGADVNAHDRGQCILRIVAERGEPRAVDLLLTEGASVDGPSVGLPPIMGAVLGGRLTTLQLLVAAGADVNFRTRGGMTPLLLALERGETDLAQELLRHGADATTVDAKGEGLISYASRATRNRQASLRLANHALAQGKPSEIARERR
jgi:ankyrin repeat protein